ncbi:MAG: ribonuclease HII [Candidatus Firestonebacteria bacterium]|nr:ribonuclease HII [Candidatus Firestonebacteria bacterium]
MPLHVARPSRSSAADRLVFEREYREKGFPVVAGIDEAGRGPWAGPVVAACVCLPEETDGLEVLDDSKKLSSQKRETYYELLQGRALSIGVGIVDAGTIDRINILQATFLAMQQAAQQISPNPDFYLIDGNRKPTWTDRALTLIKGESQSLSIAAASIVAKVTRDRLMDAYDAQFPQWGFAHHKGYGTAEHLSAIRVHGICAIHRRSYSPIAQMNFPL